MDATQQLISQGRAQVEVLMSLADALKDLKEVSDGEFYARTMNYFRSLEAYNSYINLLIECGLVKRSNNTLSWIG